jgi:hypothetical protein
VDYTKVDNVFMWMKTEQITGFSKRKIENNSGLANGTVDKYKFELHTMYNYIEDNPQHFNNVQDVIKLKPKDYFKYCEMRIAEYREGNKGVAYHLRALDDAMYAFNQCAVDSGEYQYKFKFPKKDKWSKKLNDEKVYRKGKETTVKAASRKDVEAVCSRLREIKSPAAQVAADVLWGEFVSGRRINAQLRHKAGDFNKEEGSLTSYGDKGGKDNFGFLCPEAIDHFTKLTMKVNGERKSAGAPMIQLPYQLGDKAGQDKSIDNMRKHLSGLIKQVSDELYKEGKIDNRVTSHGARKGFAQEEAFYLLHKSKKELQVHLDAIAAQDSKLRGKFDNVLKNIRSKFKVETNGEKRQFTKKELVSLIVSTSINHSRIDVMRYYLNKKFWENIEKNHRELLKDKPTV